MEGEGWVLSCDWKSTCIVFVLRQLCVQAADFSSWSREGGGVGRRKVFVLYVLEVSGMLPMQVDL